MKPQLLDTWREHQPIAAERSYDGWTRAIDIAVKRLETLRSTNPIRMTLHADLFRALQKVRGKIQEIHERIDGLGMTPVELREGKFNQLMEDRKKLLDEEDRIIQKIRELPSAQ